MEELQMLFVENIISCSSDSKCTVLHLKTKQKITASLTLRETKEMLEDYSFLRVHHSFVVNLNEVEKYVRGDEGYLVISDGSNIDVSRSRKEILIKKLYQLKKRM